MVQSRYSARFKEIAVRKYLSNKNKSLEVLSRELGCSKSVLWSWVEEYKKTDNNSKMNNTNKRPQDWKAEDKFQAVFEYENLSEQQQGEYLRRNGLHSNDIVQWKNHCFNALKTNPESSVSRNAFNSANKKIKDLEADLARKNRALAETSALLILKKKADLIFGHEEKK